MDLTSALTWIISGGGAAYAGFWLVDNVDALARLVGDYKRYAAFTLTAAIAVGAWCALSALTGEPWPVGFAGWVSQLFSVASVAIIAGQGIHAATTLAAARKG